MKKTGKFLSLILSFSIICGLLSGFTSESDLVETVQTVVRDSKIICNATIDQDFDDSSVIVIMDNITGGINKQHDLSFFGDIGATFVI
ncbi:MAG: hypothetical protein IJ404_04475 [Clostridia bacterium]|nr:hypothetical protein [Clostridia bacterium]